MALLQSDMIGCCVICLMGCAYHSQKYFTKLEVCSCSSHYASHSAAHIARHRMFSSSKQQLLQLTSKGPVFVLARTTSPSCAEALPQVLGHWFCSRNFQLSSEITSGSDCKITSRGLNLDSNLNSAAWLTGCKGFISSEVPKSTVWCLNSF